METKETIELLSGEVQREKVVTPDYTKVKDINSKFSQIEIPESLKHEIKELYYEKLSKEKEYNKYWMACKKIQKDISDIDTVLSAYNNIIDIEFESKEKEIEINKELVHHKALIQ